MSEQSSCLMPSEQQHGLRRSGFGRVDRSMDASPRADQQARRRGTLNRVNYFQN
jgi:hypothetical protein